MTDGGDDGVSGGGEVPAASPPAAVPRSELGSTTGEAPVEAVVEVIAEPASTSEPVVEPVSELAPAVEAAAPEPVEIEAVQAAEVPATPRSELGSTTGEASPPPPSAPEPATIATPPVEPSIKSRLSQAFEALKFRKRARLDKILRLAAKKGRIKNDDVEKLLHVSDSTAARYLKQLVLEAKLFVTKKENDAWYEPV